MWTYRLVHYAFQGGEVVRLKGERLGNPEGTSAIFDFSYLPPHNALLSAWRSQQYYDLDQNTGALRSSALRAASAR